MGEQGHPLPNRYTAPLYAPDRDASDIGRMVECGNKHLELTVTIDQGRREMINDGSEQGLQIYSLFVHPMYRPTLAPGGVQERRVKLLVVRVQLHQQPQDFVVDLGRAGVLAVDLVDDDHR